MYSIEACMYLFDFDERKYKMDLNLCAQFLFFIIPLWEKSRSKKLLKAQSEPEFRAHDV